MAAPAVYAARFTEFPPRPGTLTALLSLDLRGSGWGTEEWVEQRLDGLEIADPWGGVARHESRPDAGYSAEEVLRTVPQHHRVMVQV